MDDGPVLNFFVTEHRIEHANDLTIRNTATALLDFEAINRSLFMIDRMIQTAAWTSHEELTILRLGVRLFNSAGAALKCARAGYYQPAFSQVRDILETSYLLDFFKQFPEKITVWITSGADQKLFSPSAVRKALKKTDEKYVPRDERYSLFCEYAAHPSPKGFAVISSKEMMTQMGPFPDENRISAVLADLAVHLVCATFSFAAHTRAKNPVDGVHDKLRLMEGMLAWSNHRLPALHTRLAADLADLAGYRNKSASEP